ncbi:hypothetical protein [Streptomyces sp. NBC_01445]|uniref:hypothetical protein n=1 Tax=Streptomyces sp. NBC_01445 TaxID=2903869 RepID=UPI002DDBA46A|nr:hypothetical protein [Streptomyces sp. NBC_01445]WSE06314.1 hypothetical protein OG574_24950 [Streptomyces sp. NBC_01445]
MRRASIRGRRGALTGATAAVVCLGGLLAACGSSGGGDGYVAVGAAGATPERTSGRTVAPTGDVELVPLDGADSDPPGPPEAGTGSTEGGGGKSPGGSGSSGDTGAGAEARTDGGSGASEAPEPDESGSPSTGGSGAGGSGGGSPGGGSTTTPSAPDTGTPSGPAALKVGDPERKAADKRWCEDVTLDMVNTGGTAVRSGTVTFGTHIIGALGIDWATVESTQDLPVPIDAGKRKKKTWTVCVDAWRVPLGMHVETRDVSVKWK